MSNDRVEELEATVSELESTVRGLTEELVETKERVRLLEAELEPSEGATTGTPATARRGAAGRSQDDDQPESEEAAPEDVQEAAAEADKGDGDNGEDETDGSELGDDIIVA
ncbi:hypothetical protein SAMN06269185_2128 [Natronoarchaeum philippinense]|uniref:Chromosome segregation protein SMC n=1 Tax=Natronoarchaeum philippinense TaxID=558529 RepID=A0A285NWP2_NATPI|nr:hypothetical protein [Natronoarchaeum philippinense]SNZ13343.1 hypothetical protein SAMN06269185_2128 [Natronoarchaeum philippinense]